MTNDPTPETATGPATPTTAHLLEVDGLTVEFRARYGVVHAVNGISYALDHRETLAILGESGSGKTVGAQAIMGLIDSPPGFVTGGAIRYRGQDLLRMPEQQRQRIRGAKIAMIFQDALTALNPVFTVGHQIAEMFRQHQDMPRKDANAKAVELMERVRIPLARDRAGEYPHQFSGGMRQRVMIAMALALDPDVIIADEPTTALDVTVQAQIMQLLADLQAETGMGLILITHDLGVVADVADRVAVMYAGRIVETGMVEEVYKRPAHPYTEGLMHSIPRSHLRGEPLRPIRGAPPSLVRIPPGCPFHPRCPYARQRCVRDEPPLREVDGGRHSACHYAEEVLSDGR
jgi:oligopeptide transport system ATP-binding protein